MVLLCPKTFKISLLDFLTLFRTVILLFSNSDDLVPLAIYVFSITVLIAFILRRLYMIYFSIKLSPFYCCKYKFY